MFIKVKVGIVEQQTIENNDLTGQEYIDDEDVIKTEIRVNVNHIVDYNRTAEREDQTEIETTAGSIIYAQEPPESIDKKIKQQLKEQLLVEN